MAATAGVFRRNGGKRVTLDVFCFLFYYISVRRPYFFLYFCAHFFYAIRSIRSHLWLSLVCSLNANIAARMHLRVEGLRLLVHTHPVTVYRGSIED